jgi:hypothetical protein
MRSIRRTHRNMFALTGWLFADMFLAMTMIFLVASAIGTYVTTTHPPPRLLGMDKTPLTVRFSVDINGVLNNDPATVAQVESQVRNQLKNYLRKHANGKAAFVFTFGGGIDENNDTMEAHNVNKILQRMGRKHYVFDRDDIVYKDYIDHSANDGDITINIFFYLYSQ